MKSDEIYFILYGKINIKHYLRYYFLMGKCVDSEMESFNQLCFNVKYTAFGSPTGLYTDKNRLSRQTVRDLQKNYRIGTRKKSIKSQNISISLFGRCYVRRYTISEPPMPPNEKP